MPKNQTIRVQLQYPFAATQMPPRETATWTLNDETKLIDILYDHRSAGTDGMNFKEATFLAAVIEVNSIRTKGAVKTVKSCQNKWSAVRF